MPYSPLALARLMRDASDAGTVRAQVDQIARSKNDGSVGVNADVGAQVVRIAQERVYRARTWQ